MKKIAIYNNKGGVGKTTTSKRLAIHEINEGGKVLMIDLDPQGNLTSQFIKSKDVNNSIYDVLLKKEYISDCIYKTEYQELDIIPAKMNLLKANNELLLSSVTGSNVASFLKEALEELECMKGFNDYDLVIIDCPPTIDLLVTNGLVATNKVIIPLTVDNYSLDGVEMLLDTINDIKLNNNNDLKIAGVFLNRYKRSNIHKEMKNVLKDLLGNMVVDVEIGDYAVINENTFTNDEIKLSNHKVSEQFSQLFNELGV